MCYLGKHKIWSEFQNLAGYKFKMETRYEISDYAIVFGVAWLVCTPIFRSIKNCVFFFVGFVLFFDHSTFVSMYAVQMIKYPLKPILI